MKKLLGILVAVILLFISNTVKAEKVPVYMMTKEGCPACESALEYFSKLDKEHPDLLQLYVIQVFDSEWNLESEELGTLLDEVYKYFGEEEGRIATPTIVIGDYHTIGLPSDTDTVYKKIVEVKEKNKKDVFKELAEKLSIDVDKLNIDVDKLNTKESNPAKRDSVIIVASVIILIAGFIGLAIATKK